MTKHQKDQIEEELITGAIRREKQWQIIAVSCAAFGVIGCLAAATVSIMDTDPPPVVVPFDPATGNALPNISVQASSITINEAVIDAQIYSYIKDRETYNQLDNDLRIQRAMSATADTARAQLVALWTSGNPNYPPDRYGDKSEVTVEIIGITPISNNRSQVRMRKILDDPRGSSAGVFTATLMYEFRPEQDRSLDQVWENPFGFTVTQYSIRADRLEN